MGTGPIIRDYSSLSSVVRALKLLEYVGEAGRRSFSDIASFSGLPKSTLLRLIGTLVEHGFLQRIHHGQYAIGMKLWGIGCSAIDIDNVRDFIINIMRRLTEETGETSLYAVYDSGTAVYVEKVEGSHPIRAYANVGGHSPAYASATGKALLAFREPEEIVAIGSRAEKLTETTLTGPESLLRHLAEVRRGGYAVNRGEWRTGVWGVAAPVFSRDPMPIAAIGVTGPRDRIEPAIPTLAQLVTNAARELSARQGATGKHLWQRKLPKKSPPTTRAAGRAPL